MQGLFKDKAIRHQSIQYSEVIAFTNLINIKFTYNLSQLQAWHQRYKDQNVEDKAKGQDPKNGMKNSTRQSQKYFIKIITMMVQASGRNSGLNFWKIPSGEWNSIFRKFASYLQFSNIVTWNFRPTWTSSRNFWLHSSRFGN